MTVGYESKALTKRFTYDIVLYMTYVATISSKGQITLPADIRRSLHLQAGDKITIVKRNGMAEIKPSTYNDELSELRKQAEVHMKQNGTWGAPWEDVRAGADAARAQAYKDAYGTPQ